MDCYTKFGSGVKIVDATTHTPKRQENFYYLRNENLWGEKSRDPSYFKMA